MIATGNHGYLNSLRGAPLVWQSVIPGLGERILTPVCALAQNDIRFLHFATDPLYAFFKFPERRLLGEVDGLILHVHQRVFVPEIPGGGGKFLLI